MKCMAPIGFAVLSFHNAINGLAAVLKINFPRFFFPSFSSLLSPSSFSPSRSGCQSSCYFFPSQVSSRIGKYLWQLCYEHLHACIDSTRARTAMAEIVYTYMQYTFCMPRLLVYAKKDFHYYIRYANLHWFLLTF